MAHRVVEQWCEHDKPSPQCRIVGHLSITGWIWIRYLLSGPTSRLRRAKSMGAKAVHAGEELRFGAWGRKQRAREARTEEL